MWNKAISIRCLISYVEIRYVFHSVTSGTARRTAQPINCERYNYTKLHANICLWVFYSRCVIYASEETSFPASRPQFFLRAAMSPSLSAAWHWLLRVLAVQQWPILHTLTLHILLVTTRTNMSVLMTKTKYFSTGYKALMEWSWMRRYSGETYGHDLPYTE